MLEGKILLDTGLLVANWVFNPFLTDPLSLAQVGECGETQNLLAPARALHRVCSQGVLRAGWEPQNNPSLKSGMSLNLAAFVGLLHFMCLLINIVAC